MGMIIHNPVVAAVIVRDGRILLCRRNKDEDYGGLWECPGGKVEPYGGCLRDLEKAVERNLHKKIAVRVVEVGPMVVCVSARPGSDFTVCFFLTSIQREPSYLAHSDLRWIPLDQVSNFELAPPEQRFFERDRLSLYLEP